MVDEWLGDMTEYDDDIFLESRKAYKQSSYVPTEEYDDLLARDDKRMAKRKPAPATPPDRPELLKIAVEEQMYRGKPGNHYVDNPQAYCDLMNAELLRNLKLPHLQLDPGLLPFHDAVFVEGEPVENLNKLNKIVPEEEQRYHWWEEEAIASEFKGKPRPTDSVDAKVEWYLNNAKKEQEEGEASPETTETTTPAEDQG